MRACDAAIALFTAMAIGFWGGFGLKCYRKCGIRDFLEVYTKSVGMLLRIILIDIPFFPVYAFFHRKKVFEEIIKLAMREKKITLRKKAMQQLIHELMCIATPMMVFSIGLHASLHMYADINKIGEWIISYETSTLMKKQKKNEKHGIQKRKNAIYKDVVSNSTLAIYQRRAGRMALPVL